MILVCGQSCAWQHTYQLDMVKKNSVNRIKVVKTSPGGKGVNVSRLLVKHGVKTTFITYLGGKNGRKISHLLEKEGVNLRYVNTATETRICVTLIEGLNIDSSPQITELVEPSPIASSIEQLHFIDLYKKQLSHTNMVVITGSAIGGADNNVYAEMISYAKRQGIITLLDTYQLYGKKALESGPTILKINRKELQDLLSVDIERDASMDTACQEIINRFGVKWIIITGGSEDIIAYNGSSIFTVAPPKVNVVNSIGSGDAVTAGIVKGMLESSHRTPIKGFSFSETCFVESLRTATAFGSASCLSLLSGVVSEIDIESLMPEIKITEKFL